MLPLFKLLPKSLRNIFITKLYRFLGKRTYPWRLLPRPNFFQEINFDELLDNQQVYLLRRSDSPQTELFNEIGNLRSDALTKKEIPNISLFLLGGYFLPDHSIYRTKGKGSKRWKSGSWVCLDDYFNEYEVLDDCSLIYFDANEIHNVTVPYKKAGDDVNKFLNYVSKPKDKIHDINGSVKLKHDPSNLNYWHVEYLTMDYSGASFQYNGSAWAKSFCETVIEHVLCVNAHESVDSVEPISQKYFLV